MGTNFVRRGFHDAIYPAARAELTSPHPRCLADKATQQVERALGVRSYQRLARTGTVRKAITINATQGTGESRQSQA